MILNHGDIDIDVFDRNQILSKISHIKASMIQKNKIKPHNSGVYIQEVPIDPVTGLCSLDYSRAEELGYLKIDFLNNGIYKGVQSEEHLQELIDTPIDWSLFEKKEVVEKLYQLHNNFDIVSTMKPKSIEQLSMVLALIRPGKKHLIGKSWSEVEKEIWKKDNSGYEFKRSHSLAYSVSLLVQLNLLIENGEI